MIAQGCTSQHTNKPQPTGKPQERIQVLLIRHGQSQYNHEAQVLRSKLGIGATWEQYLANPQFMSFKYSEAMLDCGLSQAGRQQCIRLRQEIESTGMLGNVDLVVVSPLYRALQTCSLVLSDSENRPRVPVIVDPVFSESMRCACDVSYNLFNAKQRFPFFDYSLVDNLESSWYLANQSQHKRQVYEAYLKQHKAENYEQTAKLVNKYMEATHFFEDGIDLIGRGARARQRLRSYAQQRGCRKIMVFSHFYLIGYLINDPSSFNQAGKPLVKFDIPNSKVIKFQLSK